MPQSAVTPRLLSESFARARRSRLAHGLFILNFLPTHATGASFALFFQQKIVASPPLPYGAHNPRSHSCEARYPEALWLHCMNMMAHISSGS